MSESDSVLLGDINHNLQAILEGLAPLATVPNDLAELKDDMREVKADIKTIKAVIKEYAAS